MNEEYETNRSHELDDEILELLDGYPLLTAANSLICVLGAVILKDRQPQELAKAAADALCEAIEHSIADGE